MDSIISPSQGRVSLHSPPEAPQRRLEISLLVIFVLTLPLLNPWVRGDGVGYYAYARAPLIEHNLDFTHDYQIANRSFREARCDESGNPKPEYRTSTGHLGNHFTVGPAMLWSPFLLVAHAAVIVARELGSHIPADGFSWPYRYAVAFATGLYGFLGLFISFRLARKYVAPLWSFMATIAIWWASSLPVYMYFNPSWSHAHSAFVVALFLWYWDATREHRSLAQWLVLGVIVGLMLDVYYANLMIVSVLVIEAVAQYTGIFRSSRPLPSAFFEPFTRHLFFGVVVIVLILLLLAIRLPKGGIPFFAAVLAYYLFISIFPDWAGISSYGNRFFISLTPFFIVGLAYLLERIATRFERPHAALAVCAGVLACFVLWNLGLIYQWGVHLVPARGPISLREAAHNQFFVVPVQISSKCVRTCFIAVI